MKQKLEIRCLGHITPINERCYNCKVDEHNKYCEDYRKVGLYIYEIKEIDRGIVYTK